jgi:hypothetical protein
MLSHVLGATQPSLLVQSMSVPVHLPWQTLLTQLLVLGNAMQAPDRSPQKHFAPVPANTVLLSVQFEFCVGTSFGPFPQDSQ